MRLTALSCCVVVGVGCGPVVSAGAVAVGRQDAPIVMGPTAEHLTADHLSGITAALGIPRGDLWVIIAQSRGLMPDRWAVDVYFVPESGVDVRRGRLVTVTAPVSRDRDDYATLGPWERSNVARYAQIPTPDSNPDVIRDRFDLNRPFRVGDDVSDDDLRAAISLVRSSPPAPVPPGAPPARAGRAARVPGSHPVYLVRQEEDGGLEVMLIDVRNSPNEKSGESLRLRRVDGRWVVASGPGIWIAD